MPHGALGELAGPLQALREQCPETKIVLGLRDILGAPETIHNLWYSEGAFEAAMAFYDQVCIYGCADVFKSTDEYQFPPELVAKTQYCGYVCREDAKTPAEDGFLTSFLPEPRKKFVLVTGGGGSDASYFMDAFLDAVRLLASRVRFNAMVSTGPFMHDEQRLLLNQKAKGLPVTVTRMGQDSIRFLRRADLVISMAGYNTISEIMRFRKKAIIVPRPGPSAEQTMRCRIMTGRGLFSTIYQQDLAAENLAEHIFQKLENDNDMNETMIPDLRGASKTAAVMLSALSLES
jgi:predicted glycosyltransferase